MNGTISSKRILLYIAPISLLLGAGFASLQPGNWWIGFASFSFIFLLSFTFLKLSTNWATGGASLVWIIAIAFSLRLLVGIGIHLGLPIYGHEDDDDRAGFVFTDAHLRDDQAWELAGSDRPILSAFTDRFAYDQYGGLLAFSAFVYRYLSPDAHRPLMLILLSALIAALGIPFLWKAVNRIFGEKVAFAAAWIFALYPESILLGSSVMREPYLLTFSAIALWGFAGWISRAGRNSGQGEERNRSAWVWLGIGLLGMLLVSPSVAIFTIIILAGWAFFTNENRNLSWKAVLVFALIFMIGLLFLSASLNRSGEFDSSSPLRVVNDWLRLAVKWNAYQIERESGWVQKLFDEMPEWMRLPFVAVYGIFQPVLPAALVAPTKPIWKAIYILRSLGWYALLPMLILSFGAGAGAGSGKKRSIILWLSLLTWTWILLAALRGGGDAWDNPRYRTILFVWEATLAGFVWVWWRETRNVWFKLVVVCEVVFLLIFTQWYASRYFHWGGQLPFAAMVGVIAGLWGIILGLGWWLDKKRA
ncbi:MAG: hypothetical protein C3F07_18075 [Anaerolineales bacterium]|nr:MAG: hypothetical protein C3F07_18075 [Anaerolineales bacterium]